MNTVLIMFCLTITAGVVECSSQNSKPPLAAGQAHFTNKPQLMRGPYLQVATDTSMVIRWRTDVAVRSRVSYQTAAGDPIQAKDDLTLKTEHSITLTGLKPGTKYFYSIGTLKDTLQYGADNYFSTFPVPCAEGHYRIGVFGDCGYLSINQAKARDQFISYLNGEDINAWILLGDNAYNDGNDMEYQAKFFSPYQKQLLRKYPVYPTPGNHDYHDADFTAAYAQKNHTTPYYQNFSMPVNGEAGGIPSGNPAFYSFDLGNIHFISLDSYGMEDDQYFLYDTAGPQAQWLKKDLEANRNKGWVVAYWHHPPHSKGTHNSDTDDIMSGIRQNILPILDQYEVDLVLSGHSHVYERSKMMKGYYGPSKSFDAAKHNVDNSSGLNDGSVHAAPYIKEGGAGKGMVYVVSGSSAYVGKSSYGLNHPAMVYANDSVAGAAILEVKENRLDFRWICTDGVIRDQFTMMKGVRKRTVVQVKKGEIAELKASFVCDKYRWDKNSSDQRSILVKPSSRKTTYTVTDEFDYLKEVFQVELVR